jgi:hypothetical protein
MQELCSQIRQRSSSDSVQDESGDSFASSSSFQMSSGSGNSSIHGGLLKDLIVELKSLLNSNFQIKNKNCSYCSNNGSGMEANGRQFNLALNKSDEEIKRRDEEIALLQSQVCKNKHTISF